MSGRRSLIGALCALGALGGCDAVEPHETRQGAVIVGDDDRLEAFEIPSAAARDRLVGSTLALVYAHRVAFPGGGTVSIAAPTLGEHLHLCEGERFAEQPAAAFCSAVVIDDDLVVTAGHCLGEDRAQADDRCPRIRAVFDFNMAARGALATVASGAVYACRRVVAHSRDAADPRVPDYAVLQLDRPVEGTRVVPPVAAGRPGVGDALIVANHGAGLPLKIELGAEVVEAPAASPFFTIAADAFSGSSGGLLANQTFETVGIQIRGQPDWELVDGCARPARVATSTEQALHAGEVVAGVCGAGWPSARLCGAEARCGDGRCASGETTGTCPPDCPAPRCGDRLCERDEHEACALDCAPFPDVPRDWVGDPGSYPLISDGNAASARGDGCSVAPAGESWRALAWAAAWWLVLPPVARARRRRHRGRAW